MDDDQRGERGHSDIGGGGEAALVLFHLNIPLTPDLGRREHTITTADVTKCGLRMMIQWGIHYGAHLDRAVSARFVPTRNPSHSTSGALGIAGGDLSCQT